MELQEFIEGFAEQFEDTDASEITAVTNFSGLDEWDSLMLLTIIAWVKTAFNKSINANDIRSCNTVSDLYELVKNKSV